MDDCCEIRTDLPDDQRRVLRIVLWLNSVMFLLELAAGLAAHSTALLADSVDMLGDAIVYGASLYAIARGPAWQARVAFLKGLIMAAFGVGVSIQVIHKLVTAVMPTAEIMNVVGVIALAVNAACLVLLSRHRHDDINMRSAWLCSRNDVVANVGVLLAAGAGTLTRSGWPDILVGLAIATMFATSAIRVMRATHRSLTAAPVHQGG